MSNLIPVAQIHEFGGEARVLDLDVARYLGMADQHKVRSLIAANREELELHGLVSARQAETSPRGGRPGNAYYLNEGQALVVCALARTQKAAQVRKALIDVFMAYREGKLVHVKEHRRRLPSRQLDDDLEQARACLQAFADQPRALIDVLARCVVRLDRLERVA